ncbi:UbiC transcription regulator-associated domain protein [Clostridiales bacterium oral taxon 876 str. F0540]|nr:UbiC transcription regulator-associated domain protein [Clostridiales bacterium oral taxon 876 str. F0540]
MSERNVNRSRDEAIEKIEYYIIKNKLTPHAKIPSERDLCELWGFNRTTLRSAIQRLVVEGKLYQKKGSGTYVAVPKLVRNLQDLRSLSKEVSENGQNLASEVLSADIIECNKQITKKLHVPLGHKIYALTRLRFIDDEPATIETSFMDNERFKGIDLHDFSKESLYSVLESSYNIQIVKGEERVGIAYATEYESELLKIEPGQAVFYLTGIVYDAKEQPVEYFKSIIRADKIRFASILRRREEE